MNFLQTFETEHTKERLGRGWDGGYVISNLPGSYDAFISGGISTDITFECSMLEKHKNITQCSMFDGTIECLPPINDQSVAKKMHLHCQNLGATNSKTVCNLSKQLMKVKNAFVKLDIEGHEFRLLPMLFMHKLMKNIKQIVIEFHTVGEMRKHPEYFYSDYDDLSDITDDFQASVFKEIIATHTLVHVHANNGSDWHLSGGNVIPNVFECTYIRNDFAENRIECQPNQVLPIAIDQRNQPWSSERRYVWYPFRKVDLKYFDVYYGLPGQHMVSINDQLKRLCAGNHGMFEIPARESVRASLFGDPVFGFLKTIQINFKGTRKVLCDLSEYQTLVIFCK